ncbi:MAG: hypothetical protein JSW49_06255 [candidate division WOR-3 bacterium]|nr:MAG: hypothetical protein JSW49_06255 [candidate division WOR-3 bacterium]
MRAGKAIVICVVLFTCLVLSRCGTISSVRPMGAGNKSLVFSAGGPVAPVFDIDMPLPYSVLRYRFGLNDDTDIHIGLHPTMALFANLGFDIGVTKHFARSAGLRPGFSAGASIYAFYDFSETASARVYPDVALILTYDISQRLRVLYLGLESMIQFDEPYIVPALFLGAEYSLGSRFNLNAEARWYAPTESGDDRVVDFTFTPFGQGAVGLVLGCEYRFGRR